MLRSFRLRLALEVAGLGGLILGLYGWVPGGSSRMPTWPAGTAAAGLAVATAAAMGLFALGAWMIADRAVRPVRRLIGEIERVTAARLDRHIPAGREPRFVGHLIAAPSTTCWTGSNAASPRPSRFSADAAHELGTPIAILQGELERALRAG